MQRIFNGTAITAFANIDPKADRALVTFANWAKNPPRKPVFPSLAAAYGMSYFGLVARQNHWWQTEEFPQALLEIADLTRDRMEIVCFGTSMGATGALLARRFIGSAFTLAVSPQYAITPQDAPWEDRWRGIAAALPQIIRPDSPTNLCARTAVLYDPFHRSDSRHVAHIAAGGPIVRLPLAFSDHAPLEQIKAAGHLDAFTQAAIVANDMAQSRAIVRSSRDANGNFGLHMWLRKTGHMPLHMRFAQIDALSAAFPDNMDITQEKARIMSRLTAHQRAHNLRAGQNGKAI